MKRMTKVILVLVGFFLLVTVGLTVYILSATSDLDDLVYLEVDAIDLSATPDGTYEGEYEQFPVRVKVQVVVREGNITDIQLLEHRHGQGDAAEAILQDVLDNQSLDADLVSGATYSSKVILKAIENALNSA